MAVRSAPSLLAMRGSLVVLGLEPDGDTIRFEPDEPEHLRELRDADRIDRPESVPLRLEGIDAPETHYRAPGGGALVRQPHGEAARDGLLADAGFTGVRRDGEAVREATPARIPAAVLSSHADIYGRVVSFVLAGPAAGELPQDGTWTPVDAALLRRTLNAGQLREGTSYPTLYASAAPAHRRVLRALAAEARDAGRGVWASDATAGFDLSTQASIGPGGALVLPKLFRRCTEYLRDRTAGQSLPDWLWARGDGAHPADDRVVVDGRRRTRLSDLVFQDGDRIGLEADLLGLVFVDAG